MSKWECSPAQFMIALLIAGPVLFIWGGIRFAIFYQTTSKCSAETYGQVVNVEVETHLNLEKNEVTECIATVKTTDSSIFKGAELVSGKTNYVYEKGTYVKINYDPSDPSKYYIQHADPAAQGVGTLTAGAAVFLIGIGILVTRKVFNY